MSKTAQKLYQLKIVLNDSHPPIWRRIVVPSDITFFDLHVYIQDAMGWGDCHLHQFFIGSAYASQCLTLPFADTEWEDGQIDERKYKLTDFLKVENQWISYEYDFGDGWSHRITLEKILTPEAGVTYPVCIGGKRACPPDDCGGVWGYEELCEILKNPKHKEHQDMLDWLCLADADEFEPEFWEPENFSDPGQVLKQYKKFGMI